MRVHVWAHVHQAVAHSKHARNTLAKNALYSFEFSHTTRSLDVDTMFYIGGVEPHVSLPPFSLSLPHFDGCLSNLMMDDRIVDLASPVRQHGTSEGCPPLERDCPVGSCLRGDCVSVWNGAICHCEESPECGAAVQSSVSLSNGHVGLELPPGSAFTVETFSLAFRTRQATATLISFGSVASVKLLDGSMVLSHNSSSSSSSPSPQLTTLTLHTTVSDGLWHTVTMTTSTAEGTKMSVDSGRATASHPLPLTLTVTTLVLGSTTTTDNSGDHFDGCLSDFSINVQRFDLASVVISNTSDSVFSNVESLRATPGCGAGSRCTNYTCPAHSTCVSGWRINTCVCEDGYVPTEGGICSDPCSPNPCQNEGTC
ncbi:Cadherin EGF LAG seven-pass G-type receptor 1, partial [Geodia barretti]